MDEVTRALGELSRAFRTIDNGNMRSIKIGYWLWFQGFNRPLSRARQRSSRPTGKIRWSDKEADPG